MLRFVCALLVLSFCMPLAAASAHAQDAPTRVRDVTSWEQVPTALGSTYRRQRLLGGSVSVASGTVGIATGVLDLTGAVDIDGADGAIFGALLLGGGLGTVTMGAVALARPIDDAEADAFRMAREGATEEEIRAWLDVRRVIARRNSIMRAAGIGGSGIGLLLSAALLRPSDDPETVPGVGAIEDAGIDADRARSVLAVLGAAQIGVAVFVALRPGPEDRVLRRLDRGADAGRDVHVSLTGGGVLVRW